MARSLVLSSLLPFVAFGQPTRVADLLMSGPLPRDTQASAGVTLGSTLIFEARTAASGDEVWATDGTALGTYLVTDLAPGPAHSLPNSFVTFQGRVYFTTSTPEEKIWRTDGTTAGTEFVASRGCLALRTVGSQLWCLPSPFTRDGLFVFDAAGVGSVMPMISGDPKSGDVLDGTLLYRGADGELWKTDGTMSGPSLVRDLRPSSSTGSIASNLVRMGSRVFFVADDGVSGLELWSSDGTAAGTTLVADIMPGPTGAFGGLTIGLATTSTRLFFIARTSAGVELWVSDGTTAGTRLVVDLNPSGDGLSPSTELAVLRDEVFFSGPTSELWKSDGTAMGTVQVKEVMPGSLSPRSFFESAGLLYFNAIGPSGASEQWRTDGTTAGTFALLPALQAALREAARSAASVLSAVQQRDPAAAREPPWPEAEAEVAAIVRRYLGPVSLAQVVERWSRTPGQRR